MVDNPVSLDASDRSAMTTTAAIAVCPFLVSYPRTGSHWLRFFLEQYFDRPLLPGSFFDHPTGATPLLEHTHDEDLETDPARPAIYLYRGVVNTIYSQLRFYHGERALELPAVMVDAAGHHYRAHLRKWLVDERARASRCVLAYEWLLDDPFPHLQRAIEFLDSEADQARVRAIWPTVTHDSIKQRTTHDPRIIRSDRDSSQLRDLFRFRHGSRLIELFRADERLMQQMDPRLLC